MGVGVVGEVRVLPVAIVAMLSTHTHRHQAKLASSSARALEGVPCVATGRYLASLMGKATFAFGVPDQH